ncbi:unnamed protein product [Lathyrus oleraceus]
MPKPKPHTEISCSDKHYQLVQKILSPTVNTKSQRNCSKKSLQDLASISREDQEHQRASTNQISPSDLKPELKPFAHGMEKIEGSRTYRIQRGLRVRRLDPLLRLCFIVVVRQLCHVVVCVASRCGVRSMLRRRVLHC